VAGLSHVSRDCPEPLSRYCSLLAFVAPLAAVTLLVGLAQVGLSVVALLAHPKVYIFKNRDEPIAFFNVAILGKVARTERSTVVTAIFGHDFYL
jgi:hypothetical protein